MSHQLKADFSTSQKGPCMWEHWLSRASSCQRTAQSHIVWRECPISSLKEDFLRSHWKTGSATSIHHKGPTSKRQLFFLFVLVKCVQQNFWHYRKQTQSRNWQYLHVSGAVRVGTAQSQVPRPRLANPFIFACRPEFLPSVIELQLFLFMFEIFQSAN